MAAPKNVDAIYPLTPMQQGVLFHSLQAGAHDPGLLLVRCDLDGLLDPDRFREAWAQVVRRHPVLRSVLRWEGRDEPLQIVLRDVEVEVAVEDLRARRPVSRQRRIETALDDERACGLDLTKAPTMRVRLFLTGEDTAHLVWTCHHVLLDGWSSALVLSDLVAIYDALGAGEPPGLAPAPPFRDYVRWLSAQADPEAEAFWRDYLAGWTAPTPLPFKAPVEDHIPDGPEELDAERQHAELPPDVSNALRALARRVGVTLGTVLQGAWAVLLSRSSGAEDVAFDVTTSGRSADLPGVEAMAGMLINVLPVRARVRPEAAVADLLGQLHRDRALWVRHAHVAPAQVHAWSDTPPHLRLSESLVVVENYPHATDDDRPLRFRDLRSGITSGYPLTLIVTPGASIGLHLLYDRDRFTASAMMRLLYRFERLLEGVAEDPEQTVEALIPASASAPAGEPEAPRSPERDLPTPYVAPRGGTERGVVALWEEVLGVRPVGMEDGFFELGGRSVQVVQLLTRVERAFGQRLPMSTLLGGGTPARMAASLGAEESDEEPLLVPLAQGGSRPPLFCVHSYDGGALLYHGLAQHLDADRPVYGIQAAGLDGTREMRTDVHEMAAAYVEEVRAVQPEGPYAFAAICFGIAVALEMGRLLLEAGEDVPHLFIFDTSFTGVISEAADATTQTTDPGEGRLARAFKRLTQPDTLRELPAHVAVHGRKAAETVGRTVKRPLLARAGTHHLREWEADAANRKAWQAYRPVPYPGPVTLVRSSVGSGWDARWWHVPVWREIAEGGLTIHTVPGSHGRILHEPYVRSLAAQVRACFDAPPLPSSSVARTSL